METIQQHAQCTQLSQHHPTFIPSPHWKKRNKLHFLYCYIYI